MRNLLKYHQNTIGVVHFSADFKLRREGFFGKPSKQMQNDTIQILKRERSRGHKEV